MGVVPAPLRPLRRDAVELLRQPGVARPVEASFEPADLDVVHDELVGPIDVDLEAIAGDDWIDVGGTLRSAGSGSCRRCLTDIDGDVHIEVAERYRRDDTDPDAFVIDGPQLDLSAMVREAVLLELDDERTCSDSCEGLCPDCGVDRNAVGCECVTEVRDERWAALSEIVLDEVAPEQSGGD